MADRLAERLAAGATAVGSWVTLPGTWSAEVLGAAGYDWVVVDLQHGAQTLDGLLATLQAVELGGATTEAGLAHAGEIAAVPGVGGIFLGPVDLALALGHGLDPSMRHPDVLAAVDRCVAATRAHGGVLATTASSTDHARDLAGRGAAMVTVGSDRGFVTAGATRELSALRDG